MTRTIRFAVTLALFIVLFAQAESILLCEGATVFVLEAAGAAEGKITKA